MYVYTIIYNYIGRPIKKKGSKTDVDHKELDFPSPFKIVYTKTVDLWLHRHSLILKSSQHWYL